MPPTPQLPRLACPSPGCPRWFQTEKARQLHVAEDHAPWDALKDSKAPAPLAPGATFKAISKKRGKVQCAFCKSKLINTESLFMHMRRRHPAEWARETGNLPWDQRTARVYLRVSDPTRQEADNQRRKISMYLTLRGIKPERIFWYEDGGSGTTMEREAIQRLLMDLNAGDLFTLTHPDRLARNTADFMALTHAIRAKKADIYATDCPIDTTDAWGMAFWKLMGIIAELEWNRLVERTYDGIERVRAEGKLTGRHKAGCGTAFACPTGIHFPGRAVAGKSRRQTTPLSLEKGWPSPTPPEPVPSTQGADPA